MRSPKIRYLNTNYDIYQDKNFSMRIPRSIKLLKLFKSINLFAVKNTLLLNEFLILLNF